MSDKKKSEHSEHTATVQDESHSPSFMDLFTLDPGLVLWTWGTFILLFFILKRYAWKPLKETVEKREKDISESVENAAKIKQSMGELADTQKKIISEAEKQKETIIQEAKDIAERTAKNIENNAKETAEKIVSNAKKELEIERQRAIAELKQEAVDIIIQTSSLLIERSLDDAAHKKLVKGYVEAL